MRDFGQRSVAKNLSRDLGSTAEEVLQIRCSATCQDPDPEPWARKIEVCSGQPADPNIRSREG